MRVFSKAEARPEAADGQTHTSTLLQQLIDDVAEEDHFTLDWLVRSLPKNSFGIILLFLALISMLPVISVISRIMILILALQIILGYHSPSLPRRLMIKPLPSKYLSHLHRHAIPALKHLEKAVRPRWPVFLKKARRFTAFIAVLLIVLSLIVPLPLTNVPAAIVCVTISLAYIEHDGLLLAIALLMAMTVLVLMGIVVAAL